MNEIARWIDQRTGISDAWTAWSKHLLPYGPTARRTLPCVLIFAVLVQALTGVVMWSYYSPSDTSAWESVFFLQYHVNGGWLVRAIHHYSANLIVALLMVYVVWMVFASAYRKPRELVWIFGMLIYVALMAEAFMGYVLPWGQMSYWGAQVIINLFGAIPAIGEPLTEWIRGDFFISDATLNRFFALHVIALPLALLGLVLLHLVALRENGSNNPDGIEIKANKDENGIPVDGIPFHPYYTIKDTFGIGFFLMIFAFVIFFWPEAGGLFLEHDNFIPADPLVTPAHIKPVWYFTPYYAILKAVPDKLMGVILMGISVGVLFLLPWLDRSPAKSIRYKGLWYKILLTLFVIAFIRLGMLGMAEGTPAQTVEMRIWTFVYFSFFVLLFFLSPKAKTKPVPERLTH